MTAEISPAAIKGACDRVRRRSATPLDVRALIEQGRQDRADLSGVDRIGRHIAEQMLAYSRARRPWARAKILGDLADWIAAERDLLERAATIRSGARMRRRVPAWVPAEFGAIYAAEARTAGEHSAAELVRSLKREELG